MCKAHRQSQWKRQILSPPCKIYTPQILNIKLKFRRVAHVPYFIAIALRGACPLICEMFRFCDFLYFCFDYTFCLGLAPSSNRWTNFNRYGLNSPPSSKDVLFVGLMTTHDFKWFKAPKTLQKAAWHFPAKLAVIKSQYLRRRISGATLVKDSDVKFHEIFCPEIFHEIFHEIFQKYLQISRCFFRLYV